MSIDSEEKNVNLEKFLLNTDPKENNQKKWGSKSKLK